MPAKPIAVFVTYGRGISGQCLPWVPSVIDTVTTWPNGHFGRPNLRVYGRYQAIREVCDGPEVLVYVQDDDCVIEPHAVEALIEAHEPGMIVANVPDDRYDPATGQPYRDHTLVGWGAVFHSHLPFVAFRRYWDAYGYDDVFERCCDVVFTALTPFKTLDLGHEDLPWATDPNRMYRQPGHAEERRMVLERCLGLRETSHAV